MTERAYPAAALPAPGARGISSPPAFVTTGEDALRVISINALTGVRLKITARRLSDKGEILANAWDHTPNTNRTPATSDFPLSVGAIINLSIVATNATPLIGQTFVIAQVVRGTGAAAIVLGTLLAGYITSTQALGWPGSPIVSSLDGQGVVRLILGTTPAAGAEIIETVPSGARWELLRFCAALVTNAVAGNRTPIFRIITAADTSYRPASVHVQGPSKGWTWSWSGALNYQQDGVNGNTTQPTPLPLMMFAGEQIKTLTLGMAAGDQWSQVVYVVREWLEVS